MPISLHFLTLPPSLLLLCDYVIVFGGQSNFTVNCSGYDYCFPVTNHTWAFTEKGNKNSGKKKMPMVVIVILVLFFGVIFILAVLGFANSKRGQKLLGNTPSSSEVPVDEPKEDGVEIAPTAITTTADNDQV